MVQRIAGLQVLNSWEIIMTYCLNAMHTFVEDDGYTVIIGFSNDQFEPTKYVIIQQAKEYDDQDKNLGMDNLHIQVEDQSRSIYGGILEIAFENNHLTLSLDHNAQKQLKVDGNIKIKLPEKCKKNSDILLEIIKVARKNSIPTKNI
ncbi:Imm10 family immunity protein [Zooshikella sp. RANM57]|uniref:Imm10 family immunity protein n=1 Tax=Zooshikella sp. RANM57 TaxID=3425863 RepID=UPI003D6DDFA9